MIEIIFQFGGDIVIVQIKGNSIMFGSTAFGAKLAPIDNLKINYAGVCREFPELELVDDWKEQAIIKFKNHIKRLKTEKDKANYIIEDLKEHGYVAKRFQINGGRIKPIRVDGIY